MTPNPAPPLFIDMGAQNVHLLRCGSKHSTERRHELPSLPPTAYNLKHIFHIYNENNIREKNYDVTY